MDLKTKRAQILKELRKKKNLSQTDMAKFLAISVQAYQKYEYATAEPNFDTLSKLADFYHVTTDYLLGRESYIDPLSQLTDEELEQRLMAAYLKMPKSYRQLFLKGLREAVAQCYGLKVEDLEKASGKPAELENIIQKAKQKNVSAEKPPPIALKPKPNKPSTIQVKHSIYNVSAGSGYDLNDPDAWNVINVPDTPEAREADFALTVEGDSMEPDYSDGDIVLVRQQSDVEIGKVGVFIVKGAGYIKERGENCLISRNPDYHNIYGEARCIGKVLGKAFEDEDETEE